MVIYSITPEADRVCPGHGTKGEVSWCQSHPSETIITRMAVTYVLVFFMEIPFFVFLHPIKRNTFYKIRHN